MAYSDRDKWIAMEDEKPNQGQDVFYFFEHVGVHAGKYERQELDKEVFQQEGIMCDVFFSNKGWLCDDVTHWMPRSDGDATPDMPKTMDYWPSFITDIKNACKDNADDSFKIELVNGEFVRVYDNPRTVNTITTDRTDVAKDEIKKVI